MSTIAFDTLKLAQRLRDEGKFSPEQAEKTASVPGDTFGDWQNRQQLATKPDLDTLRAGTKTDLDALRVSAKADLEALRLTLQSNIEQLELRLQNRIDEMELRLSGQGKDLVLRIGGMIVALGGVLIAIRYFG